MKCVSINWRPNSLFTESNRVRELSTLDAISVHPDPVVAVDTALFEPNMQCLRLRYMFLSYRMTFLFAMRSFVVRFCLSFFQNIFPLPNMYACNVAQIKLPILTADVHHVAQNLKARSLILSANFDHKYRPYFSDQRCPIQQTRRGSSTFYSTERPAGSAGSTGTSTSLSVM